VKYLLDTNVLGVAARLGHAGLVARVAALPPVEMVMSLVTRGEIEFGLLEQPPARDTVRRLQRMLSVIATRPLPMAAASHYAELRLNLERSGKPIGPNDMWIAAHALAEGLILVTGNEREFSRVPGLKVENWLR
jgi:tRNA(fMet)-specific endonuclease VapC